MTDCIYCGLQISSERELNGYETCNDLCEIKAPVKEEKKDDK